MKISNQLLLMLEEAGFKSGITFEPGEYTLFCDKGVVVVRLDSIETYIIIEQLKDKYLVYINYKTVDNFKILNNYNTFPNLSSEVKTLELDEEELNNFLLIWIIRGSFLTEEENKVSNELLYQRYQISWT